MVLQDVNSKLLKADIGRYALELGRLKLYHTQGIIKRWKTFNGTDWNNRTEPNVNCRNVDTNISNLVRFRFVFDCCLED